MEIAIRLVAWPGHEDQKARREILKMDAQCFPSDNPVKFEDRYWWIAYCGTRAVGYAGLHLLGKKGFFCRAGVMKKYRRKGIHRRLIRCRLSKAKSLGLESAITYAALHNVASANSLVRAGMELYWPESRWAGQAYYFRKVFCGPR